MAQPKFNRGDKMTSGKMRQFQRSSVSEILGSGMNARRTSNQMIFEQKGDNYRRSVDFGTFIIVSEADDYIVCNAYTTGTAAAIGSAINIAKPYLLRRTPFDGVTITFPNAQAILYTYTANDTRTAYDGSTTQTEILTPQYTVGELLNAVAGISGGTGVTVSFAMLVWMDINAGGRQWSVT